MIMNITKPALVTILFNIKQGGINLKNRYNTYLQRTTNYYWEKFKKSEINEELYHV